MALPSLLLVVSLLLSAAAAVQFQWQFIAPGNAMPPARSRASMSHYGNSLFVFGGLDTNRLVLRDTYQFDLISTLWSNLSIEGPPPRYDYSGGVVRVAGKPYWIITHGRDASAVLSDMWWFDLANELWHPATDFVNVTGPVPSARFMAAGGVYPGSDVLWLSMGQDASGRKLSDSWTFNASSGEWRLVDEGVGLRQYHPFLPHARDYHAGAPIAQDKFVIVGGCSGGGQVGGPCPLDDAWQLSIGENTSLWTELGSCVTPRLGAAIATVPGKSAALLWSGHDESGPGVFPQKIAGPDYTANEIALVVPGNASVWIRLVALEGTVDTKSVLPARRELMAFAADLSSSSRFFLFGGQTISQGTALNDLWELTGDGAGEESEACPGVTFSFLHLHGVLMAVAWGLLMPLGALLGRYYRWTWPCWFICHVLCQSVAVMLTVAGFVMVFLVGTYDQPNFAHAIVGIVLVVLMLQQFLNGIFHPCVEKENGKTPSSDKSRLRKCWEVYHAVSGFLSVAVGLGQVTLGVLLIDAPMITWAVWAAIAGLWIVLLVIHEFVRICWFCCRWCRKSD